MKHSILFTLPCVFIFTLVFSCNQKKAEWKGIIEEKDGVIVVKNPLEPIYEENVFQLQKELSIGKSDNKKDYLFENVSSVAVDQENNIYIVDSWENTTYAL